MEQYLAEVLVRRGVVAPERLTEVIEGRKLRFDVVVKEGERTLGLGTHERRVIDLDAHAGGVRGTADTT